MKLFRVFSFVMALFFTNSCGNFKPAQVESTSQVQSLTGFPEGTTWPCQGYTLSPDAQDARCLQLAKAGGTSHPAIEVYVEFSGFNSAQLNKAKAALDEFQRHWNEMRNQADDPSESEFGKCLKATVNNRMFATESVYPDFARSLESGISFAVLSVQYMFEYHARTRTPARISASARDGIMGEAYVGKEGTAESPAEISLSTQYLDKDDKTPLKFAGTIFHELLHRKGYQHPDTGYDDPEYSASLVVASGVCVRSYNSVSAALFGGENIKDD